MTVFDDFFADINAEFNGIGPQFAARFTFVNFRVDVQRGENRVERRGRRVQHERVIEAVIVAVPRLIFNVTVFFMNLGSLREAGELFVNRLRNHDARIIRSEFQK